MSCYPNITVSPFDNQYVNGYRRTENGNPSSRIEDLAIINNVRFALGDRIANLSDADLLREFDEWALSDKFCGDDEKFLEFMIDSGWVKL